MPSQRSALPWGVALLVAGVLLAGCADQGTGSQPPASTLTLPPTPVKPTVIRTSPVPLPSPAITVPETTVPLVTGPGTVHQAGSSLLVEGPFYGMKAAGGNYIDLLTFDLVKAPWADPVDMENVQVTLTRYSQITGLRFEVAEQRDANGDNILADGETFVITVPVKPDFWIYRNDRFELRVLAPGSPPILVQSQVPAVLEERTVLAEP